MIAQMHPQRAFLNLRHHKEHICFLWLSKAPVMEQKSFYVNGRRSMATRYTDDRTIPMTERAFSINQWDAAAPKDSIAILLSGERHR
jgi:hypothetical protein